MTKDQILADSKLAIHCPTLEEADKLYELLNKALCKDSWLYYKENTCFYPYDGTYSPLYYAKEANYKIIPASEIITALSPPTIKYLTAPNTVIHCDTEDKANQLLKWAHDQGFKWTSGESYVDNIKYNGFKNLTCYNLKENTFGSKPHYADDHYTIIPFDSIKHLIKPKQIIANLQPGTKVRVRPDLDLDTTYSMSNNPTVRSAVVEEMCNLKNTIVTIKTVSKKYLIEEMSCYWTDEMFSEIISTPETTSNQSVALQEPTFTTTKPTKKDTFMAKIKETAIITVDQNKQAALIASKMEAGRVINKQIIKLASKHVPFWAKGYLDTPLAPVILANAVAMLGNHTGNAKVQKISELMLLAAADTTVQSFNLDKIIDDVLANIKLPKGILDSDEE